MREDRDLATDEQKIVAEARKRWKRTATHESAARKNYVEDTKFANGDARNNYQWPESARQSRELDAKPCFTFNLTRVNNNHVINDARQNKQAITVKAVGGGASYKSAQIYSGLIRHIEYQSSAQNVYTSATHSQVDGGWGYWRVVTDYADENTFDQEIFIRRIKDPLSVYLDPDCAEADRSDAKFGFVFDTMPREEAEKEWPDLKDRFPKEALEAQDGWVDENHVRVAEYFRRSSVPDELVAVDMPGEDGQPQRVVKRMSELVSRPEFAGQKPRYMRQMLAEMGAQFRSAPRYKVEWFKIAGDMIVDKRDWPGKYIPIVLLIGEETTIDGKMDRKGHTRSQIDANRNLNYWTSEGATQVALQTKVPWLVDVRSIEGRDEWKDANRKSYSYLAYNGVTDDGAPLPTPQRTQPPSMAQAYLVGVQQAEEQLRQVTGQYQASVGAPGNETSGVAITARQRQGDNATYHYIDHLANAIRYTGRIIIDLVPHVYDTPRVMKIMADDGDITEVQMDPTAEKAYFEHEKAEEENVKAIFNPNVGKYEVEADVGPSFATQRQEAFNALSQIIKESPDLMKIAGDLLMKAADFPLADEMAERLKRMVPKEALGEAPDDATQQAQQQLQMMQQLCQTLTQKVTDLQTELKSKADKMVTEAYRAETDRIAAMKDFLPTDPEGLMSLIRQTIQESIGAGSPTAGIEPPEAAPMPEQPQMPPQAAPGVDPGSPPEQMPQPAQPDPTQPPQGGFSLPEPATEEGQQ